MRALDADSGRVVGASSSAMLPDPASVSTATSNCACERHSSSVYALPITLSAKPFPVIYSQV